MPELPEVETIVNELNEKVRGRVIKNVWTDKPNLIRNFSFEEFKKKIKEKKIINVKRRAKYIIFELSDNYVLLVHQKMTGHFLLGKWEIKKDKVLPLTKGAIKEDKYNSYIHIIFDLDNNKQLAFSDLRQFGRIELYKRQEFEKLDEINKLGIEPFSKEFTFDNFKKIIKNTKTNIKKLLMDQEEIAGIGNIYASEILFSARVNPQRKTESLTDKELKEVYRAISVVLKKAINLKGSSVSDYRRIDGKKGSYQYHTLVYDKKGEECPCCQSKIEYVKLNQRGTYYCPKCQK